VRENCYGRHKLIDCAAQGQAGTPCGPRALTLSPISSSPRRIREARANYVEGREVALAGRISAHRDMGKSMFIDIKDQADASRFMRRRMCWEDPSLFQHLDLADSSGRADALHTKTGEISVSLTSFVIWRRPFGRPPEKWHGLVDTEIRYRQRYLDLMANDG